MSKEENITQEPLFAQRLACKFFFSRNTEINTSCPIGNEMLWCRNCYAISHVNPRTTVDYNYEYIHSRYDSYDTTEEMSKLRLSVIHRVLSLYECPEDVYNFKKGKLLDIGYGNGSFIRHASFCGWNAYGYDINPAEYPGVRRMGLPLWHENHDFLVPFRVITFFDSLEHFESLEPLRCLSGLTDWIFVSAPLPPDWFEEGAEWNKLKEWKHFRPGEHHHYFVPESLYLFWNNGYGEVNIAFVSTTEDKIRGKLADGSDNILTIAYRCSPRIPSAEMDKIQCL